MTQNFIEHLCTDPAKSQCPSKETLPAPQKRRLPPKSCVPLTEAEPAAAVATIETSEAQQPAAATATKPAPKKKAVPSRWNTPSVSANIAAQYQTFLTDGKQDPFVFALMCDPPFPSGDSDDEEEDEEETSNNRKNKDHGDRPKCDDGKKCYCTQLYDVHPEHPYVFIRAAKSMFVDLSSHCEVRDPDNFEMYSFNDHSAYGVLEIL